MDTPRLLITAGPTQEPIDQVRFIGNRSSGRVGIALANAGRVRSLPATLLLGPIESIDQPEYSTLNPIRFRTAADLEKLLRDHWPAHDILLMAAAVADYRPSRVFPMKLRRAETSLTLHLEPVPDLLAGCAATARPDQLIVGFALEPAAELHASAAEKLRQKRIDLIVGNPLETMGSSTIEATLMTSGTPVVEHLSAMPKQEFASELLSRCLQLWQEKRSRTLKGA